MINSGMLDGLSVEAAKEKIADYLAKQRVKGKPVGRAADPVSPARLGHLAAALLGLSDPDDPLPDLRHRAGAGEGPAGEASRRCELRQAGQSARPPSDLEACHLPDLRRQSHARDRYHGHVRRLVVVFRAILLTAVGRADRHQCCRLLAAGRPIYRRRRARDPASPLCALLHARHAQDRPCRHRRAVPRPVHPRHGHARDLQGRTRQMGAARGGEPQGRQGGSRQDRRADHGRRDRVDVEIEEERGRSRHHHRRLWGRYRALVHAVRHAARARHRVDRRRRRRRASLPAARMAAGQRGCRQGGQAWSRTASATSARRPRRFAARPIAAWRR